MKPDMYDINYNNPYHVNRHNLGDQYQANLKLTRMFSDFGFKSPEPSANVFRNNGNSLFPSTSVKNISTVRNKPPIFPVTKPINTSRNPNNFHLTKTEEPKINIDRRYNNLLFNLLPKPVKKKLPNLSEYQDKYIPHDVDYVKPIYKKAPGIKPEIKPTKIGFINPDDVKKSFKKRKPDSIDNYKIPDKLKREIKALDDIDNYNIATQPFSKVPKGRKIPDEDIQLNLPLELSYLFHNSDQKIQEEKKKNLLHQRIQVD